MFFQRRCSIKVVFDEHEFELRLITIFLALSIFFWEDVWKAASSEVHASENVSSFGEMIVSYRCFLFIIVTLLLRNEFLDCNVCVITNFTFVSSHLQYCHLLSL